MTALIVITVILLVLALCLMIRLRLHIEKGEGEVCATLSVLFWRIPIYPRPERQGVQEEKTKAEPEKKAGIKISELPSALRRMEHFLKRLSRIVVTKLLRKIVLEQLELSVAVSTGDAAETALLYPKISAGGYTVLSLLDEMITVKRYQVDIVPDFCHSKTRWELRADFSLRAMHILAVGIAILVLLLQNRRRVRHTIDELQVKG